MRNPLLCSFTGKVRGFCISLLVTFLLAAGALAQTQITTGTIQGTVLDANSAAVPGAAVELRNIGTNLVRNFTTDEDGRFVALQLPPGRYTITVSKTGFATMVVEKADVTVGQAMNLPISMKVSSVQETVTVTATPTVDTVKTESSTTLNETTVNTTPILGRKFEDLLTLTPGVSVVQGPDGDEITFAGQRGVFNNVSLDGGDYNNGFFGEQLGGQRAAIDITLEAVKEFQVVATGASAEFGRTAGGIINVISKSGTNDMHGSLFHFQRLEALTANTSDGKPLTDFRREQLGGTLGGPIRRDKAFFFFAFEGIREKLTRANLSEQLGATPCPVATPVVPTNEALINTNEDCQRLALINFIAATRGTNEGVPISRPIRNYALLAKADFNLNSANQLGISFNSDHSKNTNQTFDVATYGASANGTEGMSKIYNLNVNLSSTISSTKLNEAHFSYSNENRPRQAIASGVPADTGVGFVPSFRFGNPFFLQPNVDESLWRTHVKDNVSIVNGDHTIKFGGEWIHTLNDQVFRGFFTGRYFFDSAAGFLRYASPAAPGGFGPNTIYCSNGTIATSTCPPGSTPTGGPLLLYLQNGISTGISGVPPPGASKIKNEDLGLFLQDKWQVRPNFTLSLGLRWEAQIFPDVIVPPSQTAYAALLSNPNFPSDGTLHSPKKELQPRVGFAWDIGGKGRSVLRGSYGIYYGRQNMLTQVGSITDNGAQQFGIACASSFGCSNGAARPTWPNIVPVAPGGGIPLFASVRVFSKDYANPRIYTTNVGFEQELVQDLAFYLDFTHAKAVHLTRFLNLNRTGPPPLPATPAFPTLGDVFVTSAVGKSLYRGFTVGMRKRFSKGYQLEWNYVLAKDMDDDSNERDPFTDRSFTPWNLSFDYAPSDRDIRHKFNFISFAELFAGIEGNFRVQFRSASPITPAVRTATNRNSLRKDNRYFSFDWRLQRPFKFGADDQYALIPIVEMFNTFNNKNLINPLSTVALFNFDGFLRQGVGDPRQLQLALKFTF